MTYRDPETPPPPATDPPPAPVVRDRDDVDYEERKGIPDVTYADLQQLRWGPIWAGLLTAVGIFFLASLLAVAIGLQAAPGQEDVEDLGIVAVIVTSLIALVSFFVGGFVASWSAGISDTGRSLVNGFLVWALWLVAVAVLAALGIGSFAGAMGELFGQIDQPSVDVEPDVLIASLRDSSWSSFLALGLTALAAMLGGTVGAREELRGAWTRMVSTRVARR